MIAAPVWKSLRRILLTVPVLWVVISVVFLLIHLVPGDPIVQMLGEGATATDISALRHAYGLDAPLTQQYTHYWHGILHADLGQSLRTTPSRTSFFSDTLIRSLSLPRRSSLASRCRSPLGSGPRCTVAAGRIVRSALSPSSACRSPTSPSAPFSSSSSPSSLAGFRSQERAPEPRAAFSFT
jgi:hypothetical protein